MISPRDVLPVGASPASSPSRRIVDAGGKALSLFACLATLVGCIRGLGFEDPKAAIADVLRSPGVAPRLSVARTFRACRESAPDDGTITRARCPVLRPSEARRLADLAAPLVGAKDDPAALQTLALVELVADDSTGRALDRAISTLRRAAELTDRSAPVLADLAAALVIRAERTQAPRDLLEAYETAEQAVDHEPRNPAALYNRALALDRFGLVDEVARDWQAYLAVDSTSGWADEARRRRRDLLALRPPPAPRADASLADYARYAAADPQGARELGMDRLLGEWGEAIEAGNATRAEDRLRRAAALGEALARHPGGDASLGDAVRAIRAAAPNLEQTRTLARAHQDYAAGRKHFEDAQYDSAQQAFSSAATSDASPVLHAWAVVHEAGARILTGNAAAGEQILRGVVASADFARYPSLAARARWALGSALNRAERYEQALPEGMRAAATLARVGESENGAGALHVVADARFVLGEPDSGYAALHAALQRARPHRGSVRLHNLLVATGRTAAADGFPRLAVRLHDEDVRVAARNGRALYAAEAHLARARLLAANGHQARAAQDVTAARALTGALRNQVQRLWLQADLRITEAFTIYAGQPARATSPLDSAAAYFLSRVPFRALPALVAGAESRLVGGDVAGAAQRLEAAVRLLEDRRDSIRLEPRRAAVFEAARSAIDRVVMLRLREGRVPESLLEMDRGRASLALVGAPPGGGTGALEAPPGEVFVEYALVADTLLAWTVVRRSVELFRTPVDTLRLKRVIGALEARLEEGASKAEVTPALAELYDRLLAPIRGRLGPAETSIAVIADGLLASVPYSALYDSRRGRYLVEDHPVRFAASLREARRRPLPTSREAVLLIADPAFDRAEYPLLDPLAHARSEVRRIAAGYRHAAVLEGRAATRAALQGALARAGIVHFAGHAIFDDARPERSQLVLASTPGSRSASSITAGELSRLDLRHVQLVVLSACRTVRVGPGRAGGFAGLSGALLAAGVGGTIASTWDVDDRRAGALMSEFHRIYRDRRNGPGALRAAQLALLRSNQAGLATPSAWAAFRYSGR
jgi:CHAT domain-containing protein